MTDRMRRRKVHHHQIKIRVTNIKTSGGRLTNWWESFYHPPPRTNKKLCSLGDYDGFVETRTEIFKRKSSQSLRRISPRWDELKAGSLATNIPRINHRSVTSLYVHGMEFHFSNHHSLLQICRVGAGGKQYPNQINIHVTERPCNIIIYSSQAATAFSCTLLLNEHTTKQIYLCWEV